MTREEAIERVKTMRWEHATNKDNPDHEAMTMAIKALEQEPCDDAVSRQAVIGIIKRNCIPLPNTIKHLEDLPSVLPEREQGEWIEVHPLQEDDGGAYLCSKCRCGHPYIAPHWKYCPNCGAEMR